MQRRVLIILHILGCIILAMPVATSFAAEKYEKWEARDYAIASPLGGFKGQASRGKQLVIARDKGNCLACHSLPIPEETFHGNIGPPLHGVAKRLSVPQLRLRVVDEKIVNPQTIMPGYYRMPSQFNQVHADYENKTMLTAREVEDIVAYLATLQCLSCDIKIMSRAQ